MTITRCSSCFSLRVQALQPILLLGTVLLAALAGCMPSLESTEPPERVYWLDTIAIDETANMTLRVSVVPGLNSDRIWILEKDQRLNYYAGALWVDALQPLLQSVMARSLNAGAPGQTGAAVEVTIERFFALESATDDPPRVVLKARIEGVGSAGAACHFDSEEQPATGRLRDIVAAHQALLDRLTREVNRIAGDESDRCR